MSNDKKEEEFIIIEEGLLDTTQKFTTYIGLPDVGLVGLISAVHITQSWNLKKIGYIDSSYFPPVMVIHNKELMHPFRIYSNNEDTIVIMSETVIPPIKLRELSEVITDWLRKKNVSRVFLLGGLPVPNRIEIEVPNIYVAHVNEDNIESIFNKFNINYLEEGYIAGPYATLLASLKRKKMRGIYIVSECYRNIPDPGAAARLLELIEKISGKSIKIESLKQDAEVIRLKMRDLMRRTGEAMRQMAKVHEGELPPMYT